MLGTTDWIDNAAQYVVRGVVVDLAAGLVKRQELGRGKISIERVHGTLRRQSQSGRYMRRLRLFFFARFLQFSVECDSLRRVFAGSTVAFVLIGRVPVHERL